MALYLEGKTSVDTNELSPKEATQMSHDVKYIGMDVHKEAMVIAVLNGSGKLIMETIVETKASSILQFLHGLRGELHVTWEEGTWAAWLYDLLLPQTLPHLIAYARSSRTIARNPHISRRYSIAHGHPAAHGAWFECTARCLRRCWRLGWLHIPPGWS
jgi:hypothetical protein